MLLLQQLRYVKHRDFHILTKCNGQKKSDKGVDHRATIFVIQPKIVIDCSLSQGETFPNFVKIHPQPQVYFVFRNHAINDVTVTEASQQLFI